MKSEYPKIFEPIQIGTMMLKNRVALAPMGTRLGNRDETISDDMVEFYSRIARGGTGLIITGVAAVSRDGGMGAGMNSIYDDRFNDGFRKLADSVHKAGSKLVVHLMHGGMEAYPFYAKRKRLVSPSDGIFGPNRMRFDGMDFSMTAMASTAMTLDDIRKTGDDFAAAAQRAKDAGADAVEINGAQGFLIQQFYSPHFNKRTDAYGGSLENRMRFPLEVLSKVRSAVGPDFPIIFRMVASEGEGGGIAPADARLIARTLEEAGVDALHVTAGRGVSPAVWSMMMPIAEDGHLPIIDQVAEIKAAVNVPVIGVQRIVDPAEAENVLAENKADMVALGRGLIADPDWVNKASRGRAEDIRRCIGCLQGCIGTQMTAGYANCLQNPAAGRERQMEIVPAPNPRKVLVVGGGPAGLEAALVAGLRGHAVTLCEKDARLGGQWNLAATTPGKQDFSWVVDWRVDQIAKLDNVSVRLGSEVTPETVAEMAPDVAVIATGSLPVLPDIPGVDGPHTISAHAVLSGEPLPEGAVAVIGAGATGCETANYLGSQGRDVTLIEATANIGAGEEPVRMVWLKQSLAGYNVRLEINAPVMEISSAGEIHVFRSGCRESLGIFGAIVVAAGVHSYDPISARLKETATAVYVVGDACCMATNGLDALHHAAEIARTI